jgi:hypothetical protein
MTLLSTRRHRIAAAVTAGAIALGGGSAAIIAATTSASAGTASLSAVTKPATTKPATTKPTARAKGHHRGLLARTDHATIELKVKGQWVTYDLDRGKITSVSSTSISLARPDGQSVTLGIASSTHFGHKGSASALKTGVEATVTSENGTARRVVAAHHAKAAAAPSTSATSA